MGYGNYSQEAHQALIQTRAGASKEAIFKQQECHPLMNPKGVRVRESRDSAEHPESLGIVFALDVTGSMGNIPVLLAKQELPKFMKVLSSCGVRDAQVLFMAVGDATSDRAPLQVGQFETTAELMDQWLTRSFLEGGGGGSGEESYELALYFLAQHTEMDCYVKRARRGYVFLTGDENPYPVVSRHIAETIIGDRIDEDIKTPEIVAELQKTFVPFFLIPDRGRTAGCEKAWRSILGDHVLCMESPEDVCYVAAGALLLGEGVLNDRKSLEAALLRADISRNRLAPVIRALSPLLDGKSVEGLGTSILNTGPARAIRRLFRNR